MGMGFGSTRYGARSTACAPNFTFFQRLKPQWLTPHEETWTGYTTSITERRRIRCIETAMILIQQFRCNANVIQETWQRANQAWFMAWRALVTLCASAAIEGKFVADDWPASKMVTDANVNVSVWLGTLWGARGPFEVALHFRGRCRPFPVLRMLVSSTVVTGFAQNLSLQASDLSFKQSSCHRLFGRGIHYAWPVWSGTSFPKACRLFPFLC